MRRCSSSGGDTLGGVDTCTHTQTRTHTHIKRFLPGEGFREVPIVGNHQMGCEHVRHARSIDLDGIITLELIERLVDGVEGCISFDTLPSCMSRISGYDSKTFANRSKLLAVRVRIYYSVRRSREFTG